ncbi:MAG: right-handed parallel beta-helix repeat-containing protein, partial [Burkholderiaceae bacterium]
MTAADLYVDGRNGNDRNAGTRAAPFLNFWYAWNRAQPGDTIRLLPTVTYGPQWLGNKSGLPGAPITVRGEGGPGNMTKVSGMGQNFGINAAPGVNYINIENFDITAPGHGNNSGWSAIYLARSHHVNITGNYAHDSGCAGIQAYGSDYVTISGNRVANNSKDTWNHVFCSGISNHENLDVDSNTGVKMRIENNVVWGNTNTPSPGCSAPCTNSDGSGIIIDDNRRSQTDGNAYRGRTLIRNNVVFRNGGRGIAIYYSNAVDIQGNTVYLNNRDPDEGSWRPGEIGITFSGDVTATGNVLYSDGAAGTANTGAHVAVQVTDCASGGPVSVSGNVAYNP